MSIIGKNGYRRTKINGKWVYDHILAVIKMLGYRPTFGHTHHIDENKLNNAPENLLPEVPRLEHQGIHQLYNNAHLLGKYPILRVHFEERALGGVFKRAAKPTAITEINKDKRSAAQRDWEDTLLPALDLNVEKPFTVDEMLGWSGLKHRRLHDAKSYALNKTYIERAGYVGRAELFKLE